MADLSHKVLPRIYDPQAQAYLDDTHQLQADSVETSAPP